MIAYQQREFAGTNHFSFTDPIHRASNDHDEVEFTAWAEGMGKPGKHKGGAWARRSPRRIYTNIENGGEELRWLAQAADDSEVPSPKLWEQSGSPATQSAKTSPVHHHCPPISRAQVIARYRQELMDLVRDAPESAYELSLKDIVELPATRRTGQETPEKEVEKVKEEQRQPGKKATARRMSRSESMDAGVFLLKMFSPFSLGGKRSKSAGSAGSVNSKVMLKPALSDREKGGAGRRTDGEWGNQESGERSSGGDSCSSTNGSNISSSSRKLNGCYSFLLGPKSKTSSI